MSTDIMDKATMLPPIYFLFNILIFLTTVTFSIYVEGIESKIKYGIIFSILITIIGVYYTGFSLSVDSSSELAYRAIGTFNNPNQLGYYTICIGGIVTLLFLYNIIGLKMNILLLGAIFFLTILSLSKAAMISVVFYLLSFGRRFKKLFILSILLFALIMLNSYENFENLKFFQRLADVGSANDDNLERRGYGVLYNPDFRLLYGWGEGYTNEGHEGGGIGGHYGEVHSTLGGMVISYGLLGLSMLFAFMLIVFHKVYQVVGLSYAVVIFMPFLLFGITHNGIRFSIFWIFLGLIYGLSSKKIDQKRRLISSQKLLKTK